jgi:molybdopterin-binding protein
MMAWTALFFVCVLLLLLLPLAPALLEWRNKRDAQPLKVVRDHDGNIKHFAHTFGQFVSDHFAVLLRELAPEASVKGQLADGAEYQLLGTHAGQAFAPVALGAAACTRVVLGAASLQLGHEMLFEKEVYAAGAIGGGDRNAFRAILAGGPIAMGEHCAIARWAHSDADITLGSYAKLYGRISAGSAIALRQHSRFGRMQAPLIRFGASLPSSAPRALARTPLAVPPAILDQTAERWLVGGSLNVPPASFHHTSLVTRKHLTIGAGSHIAAGIKSNGDLRLEGDLRIDGAVVCSGTLYIGPGCIIKGPVVCEKTVTIAAGTVIGSLALPTTVTAPEMRIEEGVLAHGSVWAREIGFVAPPRARRA